MANSAPRKMRIMLPMVAPSSYRVVYPVCVTLIMLQAGGATNKAPRPDGRMVAALAPRALPAPAKSKRDRCRWLAGSLPLNHPPRPPAHLAKCIIQTVSVDMEKAVDPTACVDARATKKRAGTAAGRRGVEPTSQQECAAGVTEAVVRALAR